MECNEVLLVGQTLQVVNENSSRKAEARVVSVQRRRDGKTYLGIEFTSAEINFWHMTFPIPGQKPMRKIPGERKATTA